jgi:hypothetical protein
MGSATYYLKAKYESAAAAEAALPAVQDFFEQVGGAQDYWQSNRGKAPDRFWPEFQEKFPLAHEFLVEQGLGSGDCNNALAGMISFGSDVPSTADNEIRHCEETWHCADWTPLCDWLVKRYGAEASAFASDEYADIFDTIHL